MAKNYIDDDILPDRMNSTAACAATVTAEPLLSLARNHSFTVLNHSIAAAILDLLRNPLPAIWGAFQIQLIRGCMGIKNHANFTCIVVRSGSNWKLVPGIPKRMDLSLHGTTIRVPLGWSGASGRRCLIGLSNSMGISFERLPE